MSKEKKKPQENLYTRLMHRYRISVGREDTKQEVWSITASKMQHILTLVAGVAAICFIVFALFAWTPLHNILPGYLKSDARSQIVDNALRVDSLDNQIKLREQYIKNIARILTDDIPLDSIILNDSIAATLDSAQSWTPDMLTKSSPEAQAIVNAYENEEQFNLTMLPQPTEGILFHTPVKGKIIKTFNPREGNYGIEIEVNRNTPATAVLDGTIVAITHTIAQGYVVVVQHNNNYVSIYRNMADCYKKTGNKVVTGERIGTVGNTASNIAPFELWHNGIAVDPQQYITF